jgi:hypothetical protein
MEDHPRPRLAVSRCLEPFVELVPIFGPYPRELIDLSDSGGSAGLRLAVAHAPEPPGREAAKALVVDQKGNPPGTGRRAAGAASPR